MSWFVRMLMQHWKTVAAEILTAIVKPYLEKRGKLDDALRYATIAKAMAAELLAQYPTANWAALLAQLTQLIVQKWQLPQAVAARIATLALAEAEALRGGAHAAGS